MALIILQNKSSHFTAQSQPLYRVK